MAKRIEFDGKIHEFPDDFTDSDISKALKTSSPTPSNADIPGYGKPAYSNPPAPPMVASDADLKRQGLAKGVFGDIQNVSGGGFNEQADRMKHVWTENVPFLDTAAAVANKRPMAAVHRGLGDAMSVAAPFAAASMAATPARSLLRIGAGGAAAHGVGAVANEMDLPPDAADLASDAAGLLVGGPMGSRAFTGRAGALGKALPELLPSRFRTKYNALAGALKTPTAATPSAPVDPNSISSYARSLGLPEAPPLEGPPVGGTPQAAPSWPPRGPLPAPIPGSPIAGGGTTGPQAMISPPRQQMPSPVGTPQIGAPMPPQQGSQLPSEINPPQAQAPSVLKSPSIRSTGERFRDQTMSTGEYQRDAAKLLEKYTPEQVSTMEPQMFQRTPGQMNEIILEMKDLSRRRKKMGVQ